MLNRNTVEAYHCQTPKSRVFHDLAAILICFFSHAAIPNLTNPTMKESALAGLRPTPLKSVSTRRVIGCFDSLHPCKRVTEELKKRVEIRNAMSNDLARLRRKLRLCGVEGFRPLSVNTAHSRVVCDPINRQHVSSRPRIHRVRVGIAA